MPTRVPGLSRILYVHVTIYKRRRKTKCKCSQTKKVLRVLQNLRRTADSKVAETSNSTPVRSAFP